jgi:hypothetical protein
VSASTISHAEVRLCSKQRGLGPGNADVAPLFWPTICGMADGFAATSESRRLTVHHRPQTSTDDARSSRAANGGARPMAGRATDDFIENATNVENIGKKRPDLNIAGLNGPSASRAARLVGPEGP